MQWSLPARGAWIEIGNFFAVVYQKELSLPARGAWIEINTGTKTPTSWTVVAPREGSVD